MNRYGEDRREFIERIRDGKVGVVETNEADKGCYFCDERGNGRKVLIWYPEFITPGIGPRLRIDVRRYSHIECCEKATGVTLDEQDIPENQQN